jgi:hypothetical protein
LFCPNEKIYRISDSGWKGEQKMVYRSVAIRVLALVVCLLTIAFGTQFSAAETVVASPLGTIVTQGSVIVGNTSAPTGTTIFAGDKVTSNQPALISFNSGSRIEMTKAAATFSRQGKVLVVNADQGLIRFNFVKGESVQINAGKFRITGTSESGYIGELGLNAKGQLVMTVTEGVFTALNTETGEQTKVEPEKNSKDREKAAVVLGSGAAGTGAAVGASTSAAVSAAGVVAAGAASAVGTIIGVSEAVQSPEQK